MPAARKNTSLTMLSTATAMTMPSWRSVGSRRRTPNMMVNRIMSPTMMGPSWAPTQEPISPSWVVMTAKVAKKAFICRAT